MIIDEEYKLILSINAAERARRASVAGEASVQRGSASENEMRIVNVYQKEVNRRRMQNACLISATSYAKLL